MLWVIFALYYHICIYRTSIEKELILYFCITMQSAFVVMSWSSRRNQIMKYKIHSGSISLDTEFKAYFNLTLLWYTYSAYSLTNVVYVFVYQAWLSIAPKHHFLSVNILHQFLALYFALFRSIRLISSTNLPSYHLSFSFQQHLYQVPAWLPAARERKWFASEWATIQGLANSVK